MFLHFAPLIRKLREFLTDGLSAGHSVGLMTASAAAFQTQKQEVLKTKLRYHQEKAINISNELIFSELHLSVNVH